MNSENISRIISGLKKEYPDATCSLVHTNAFQLLIATILSAQCTDERVNMVTPGLFKKYPDADSMAEADSEELKTIIRSTGFYNNKAKSILGASQEIVKRFAGKVPDSMEQLLTLSGVARKTANVVLGTAFKKAEGIVVDTHVKRIAGRLGLTKQTNPEKIEQDLMKIIPRSEWIWFAHALVQHGRTYCIARKPLCTKCPVQKLCPFGKQQLAVGR